MLNTRIWKIGWSYPNYGIFLCPSNSHGGRHRAMLPGCGLQAEPLRWCHVMAPHPGTPSGGLNVFREVE